MESQSLRHFYINEEQSIYLLSHRDAQKLKGWLDLCEGQLKRLGYRQISLVGKGAYGFVYSAIDHQGRNLVFKFARITLPRHVQERLEEEGFMLSKVNHLLVPKFIDFQRVRGQSVLAMERVPGLNLEELGKKYGRLPVGLLLKIASQLAGILLALRSDAIVAGHAPIVHGDIKPSNIIYNEESGKIGLIDWGAAVFSQLDSKGQYISNEVLGVLSTDLQQTNAKLGDIYFIGEEQLKGELSSPRFDEQGVAGTLYALASGQASRFGRKVITPLSLGLPVEFARTLEAMLADDRETRSKAGDYFLANMRYMKHIVVAKPVSLISEPLIPIWLFQKQQELETVVYSSRKSFLRREMDDEAFSGIDGTELERYYRNFLSGMGDTEKAFVVAVSYLGRFPVVGGLAMHWDHGGIYIDSSLNLYDETARPAFVNAVNNVIALGRAICKTGVFKSCMFDARKTLHIERASEEDTFVVQPNMEIPYEVSETPGLEDESRLHSYFEDGDDPDEMLSLPEEILHLLEGLNKIHHTGCIIFESVELDLKIHNYLKLLDPSQEQNFKHYLREILDQVHLIKGLGVSGFMKLPYKDTKFFSHLNAQPERYMPRRAATH